MLGLLLPASAQAVESTYLAAYAKAVRAYGRAIEEATRKGAPLSAEDRRQLHDELFADAHKAYAHDVVAVQKEIRKAMADIARDIIQKIENKEKNGSGVAKKENVERAPGAEKKDTPKAVSISARAASRAGASDQSENSGTADTVSFTSAAPSVPAPAGKSQDGGAGTVRFLDAPSSK